MSKFISWAGVWYFLLIAAGSICLYQMAPLSTKDAVWTHAVLRNWEEHGWARLGGRLVYNPGGLGAVEQPIIYGGHRAFSLYPAFVLGHLTGGAGRDGSLFYVALSLVVAFSIWYLLGRGELALAVASAVVLSAGYLRTTLILDPLTIPVMLGIPFTLGVLKILARERLNSRNWMVLAVITGLYAAINWTTAFTFSIGLAFLWLPLKSRPARWLAFGIIAGCAIVAVGLVSVLHKMGGETGPRFSFAQMFDAYLFGSGGYAGYSMSWVRAIVRIAAASIIGLLPLIAIYVWAQFREVRSRGAIGLRASLPLVVALLTIAGMRNYFAHHPWMAAPVLIIGLVLSICLAQGAEMRLPIFNGARSQALRLRSFAFAAICLFYACGVVMFLRFNAADEEALLKLVRNNTGRHDVLLYSAPGDPWLANNVKQLAGFFDRVMVERNQESSQNPLKGRNQYILTAFPEEFSGNTIAETVDDETALPGFARQALTLYRRRVAKRTPGDRLELGRKYYLCQVSSPAESQRVSTDQGSAPNQSTVRTGE